MFFSVQDVNMFKEMLKDDIITNNLHEKIQNKTLEKLSKECLE